MPNKVRLNQDYPEITESDKLYARGLGLIPALTQTLAKGPGQYVQGVAPKFIQRGKGSHVWDVDGNEYIDYNMGIGPVSLGYSYDKVDQAITEQLKNGITFSMMHPLEVEVAELIREVVPNAECVRFSKTGCDITSAAIRLARAYTGREKVLCCGYHGWHDWYISVTDRNKGIPNAVQDLTHTFNYNDISSVIESIDNDTACVILEPVVFEEPKENFLHNLKDVCQKNGTLLIFDEMWTGFRLLLGGAQKYYGVNADLACFSKAIANGMPLSALTGRKDIMSLLENDVFFFTTFGGEALSLAAAKATINEMKERNVSEYISIHGKRLMEAYNDMAEFYEAGFTKCSGLNCRSMITFDQSAGNPLELKSLLQQELIKRGILWSGTNNISFSHSAGDIEYTIEAFEEALQVLSKAVKTGAVSGSLRGKPVEPVFRKTSNFNVKPRTAKAV